MIVAEHVTKHYGARAAVSDLSFRIEAGQVVGLLGLNGAGKTTTMRMLSGLIVPTVGRISIDGLDLQSHPDAVRARIGFLPETPPLYNEMTVHGFLTFVANIKGVRGDVSARVQEAIEATDLAEVQNERIGTLSHGFKKRVGIAQAIVHSPALILLDEPTSGLDPVQVVHMRKLIRGLAPKHTVLVSSHILAEIHEMCDRIFVLDKGRIAASGTEEELASMVSGGMSVEIEVRGSAERLEALLTEHAGVVRHQLTGTQDDVAQARVELATDTREALAAALIGAGLGLRRLERVELELESIFLKLTASPSRQSDLTPVTPAQEASA